MGVDDSGEQGEIASQRDIPFSAEQYRGKVSDDVINLSQLAHDEIVTARNQDTTAQTLNRLNSHLQEKGWNIKVVNAFESPDQDTGSFNYNDRTITVEHSDDAEQLLQRVTHEAIWALALDNAVKEAGGLPVAPRVAQKLETSVIDTIKLEAHLADSVQLHTWRNNRNAMLSQSSDGGRRYADQLVRSKLL